MIYGLVVPKYSELLTIQLCKIKELIEWPGCVHEGIKWGNFSGGVLYNPKLPYRIEDFYSIDVQKDVMVLMSGVIYNREEIIRNLQNNNPLISTPQLVLEAFIFWGEEFVKKLNGDFAIYIYNRKSNNSFLFRDHIGVCPLTYSKKNDAIWFSSDGMALCKALYAEESVDEQFLQNYLINYGLQSTPLSSLCANLPNRKVQKVLPGHYLHIYISEINIKKYWHPEDIREDTKLDFETATREIKTLLKDSVKIRSDQRFIASAHLSGGLDSGIVASLVRKEFKNQNEFPGFCWTPNGLGKESSEIDERVLVKKISELNNINLQYTIIDTKNYIDFLSEWRADTDLYYEFKIRKTCQQKGINLIFSGWGGDEFISYDHYGIDSDLVFKFQWRSFLKKNPINKPKRLIAALLYNVLLPAISLRYYSLKKPFSSYSKYLKNLNGIKVKTINDFFNWRSRKEMHLRYLYQYHIPQRTEDWNINGTRSGIEYRYPLIDKRIIEFMLQVPSRLLFNNGNGRVLIREISAGLLPEEARWNKSKTDPIRLEALFELQDNVCKELMNEVDEFKINPIFNFINFDLLIKDISAYREGLIKERPSKSFEILLFLKKAHEFTKAYAN